MNVDNGNKDNGEKDNGEKADMIKQIKDLQKKLYDLEKSFKSYCMKVNIDHVKSDIKNINEAMGDLNSSFNIDIKSVMENLSKI